MLSEVAEHLSAALGARVHFSPARSVHGGDINESYQWQTDAGPVFVKVAARERLPMFEAEAEGLKELAKPAAVRVPRVLAHGATQQHAYLALEWIEPKGRSAAAEARLGRELAEQHRFTAVQFGWHRDNTIGLTPQLNARASDWVEFFRERRLRYQLDLAGKNGYGRLLQQPGERLLEALPELFRGHDPQPSLLHGDLWGGNWFATTGNVPVIFDPAVYYGDREADIAMTHLFGGFGAEFHRAYESVWPLPSGHEKRRDLYNLYHILNHANLFGGGYAQQARTMIDRLLAKIR